MTRRRTLYLPALIVAAMLMACAAAVLAVPKEAEATFPGKNGKIAFTSLRDAKTGSEDIYTMNPRGTAVYRLTNYSGSDFEPAWSPDGTKIAFMSYRHGTFESTYSLYTMNARGTAVEPLISNPQDDHDPAWSPDGTKIAFARYRDGNDEIYTINPNGTGLDRLTNDPKPEDDAPAWSPDGKKIAFSSNRDGNYEIYTINPNGTQMERITNDPKGDFSPDWSPDGGKIAFSSNRNGNPEIYTMKANGTSVERLTNNTQGDYEPAWSPDGNRIAFTSDRDGNSSAIKASQDPRSNSEIYTMNPNGQALDRLTNNSVGDFNPDWQPLSPPDNTTRAVKVISTSPKANATRVAPAANIRATFSKDMKAKTINNTTFKLFKKGSTTKIAATVGYSAATDKATLNPRKRLQKGAIYKAVVTKGAKALAGKSLDQNTTKAGLQQKVWSFKAKR
jgi:Tol biopolymer transport system component